VGVGGVFFGVGGGSSCYGGGGCLGGFFCGFFFCGGGGVFLPEFFLQLIHFPPRDLPLQA